MQAFVTDAFWEGGGEKYERHSETSSCLCNPSSYVYVNIDNARISTRMILGAKRKKKKEKTTIHLEWTRGPWRWRRRRSKKNVNVERYVYVKHSYVYINYNSAGAFPRLLPPHAYEYSSRLRVPPRAPRSLGLEPA